MNPSTQAIPLSALHPHPMNANVMNEALLEKLTGHIRDTGCYPPLIVRPTPSQADAYQLLDGHHRCRALAQLGRTEAMCLVWDVDDAQALVLLTTLNRLQGQDDPHRRAALIAALHEQHRCDVAQLAKRLPETAQQLRKYLALRQPPPKPAPPKSLVAMPTAVHFFLTGAQRAALDTALAALGGTREEALMKLIERQPQPQDRTMIPDP